MDRHIVRWIICLIAYVLLLMSCCQTRRTAIFLIFLIIDDYTRMACSRSSFKVQPAVTEIIFVARRPWSMVPYGTFNMRSRFIKMTIYLFVNVDIDNVKLTSVIQKTSIYCITFCQLSAIADHLIKPYEMRLITIRLKEIN